jgi:predicted metal-dependent phosphoesterase TrpH
MESLHNHTKHSDGTMLHRELFDRFEAKGGSIIAFTDHDALPSDEVLAELDALRSRPLKWIIGIEMTTLVPRDLGERGILHLVGLFVDPKNAMLKEHTIMAQEARTRRMQGMVENLHLLGFRLTEADCEEEAAGESVGRPHIVRALARYPENEERMRALVEEMREAAMGDERVRAKYERMLAAGEAEYPYFLFLSPEAFRPAYVEMTYIPDFDHAVRLIREAGGIASIAHYESVRSKLPLSGVEKLLATGRVDAVETVYGMKLIGTPYEEEVLRERETLREIVRKTGALETGGGDIHTPEDLDRYCSLPGFFGATSGFTERILQSGNVDRRWSSIPQ